MERCQVIWSVGTGVLDTASPPSIDTGSSGTSLRATSYGSAVGTGTANVVNQYTAISHPPYFNVRGTRSPGAPIVVNGGPVGDSASNPDSGYQPGGSGACFRDEVANTSPPGTSSPDLFEPVKVTQSGYPFSTDDPVQYVPKASETLTYDLDGNLLSDGRWSYTWDAADRLVKMVCCPFISLPRPPSEASPKSGKKARPSNSLTTPSAGASAKK